MKNNIDEVNSKVKEFEELIKYNPLVISEPYYPYKEYKEDPKLTKIYPNADSPGVYIFILENEKEIVYVGSSTGALGNRIWYHIGRTGKAGEAPYPNAEMWIKNRDDLCVVTIPFPKEHFFLGPALELFLIDKLKPVFNKIGK